MVAVVNQNNDEVNVYYSEDLNKGEAIQIDDYNWLVGTKEG